MIKEMKLPEIAENVDSAVVLNILVSEGDHVEKDDPVAEMESDKATFDLPAEESGTVKEINVKKNDEVKVGQVVMTLETGEEGEEQAKKGEAEDREDKEGGKKEEEEKPSGEQEKKESSDETSEGDEEKEEEEEEKEKEEAGEPAGKEKDMKTDVEEEPEPGQKKTGTPEETGGEGDGEGDGEARGEQREEVPASPSVRRLARELGVDIYKVEGTGPADRITSDDVKSFAKEIVKRSDDQAAGSGYRLPDFSQWGETYEEDMDSIRKRTAQRMVGSWQDIPHVFQFGKADITRLEEFRKKHGKEVEKERGKLTVTAILLKVVAEALRVFPRFNASLDMQRDKIIYKKYIHIGVAVDTERGLLVPVIRDADKKSILQLSLELGEVAEKARNKKIKPGELKGGNIAISNLGGIGGTQFTPIVYQPNVAVIGVSRATTEPVFTNGEFRPRLILPLSLSYDHRLIDGAEGARFMKWLCDALENPLTIFFKGGK